MNYNAHKYLAAISLTSWKARIGTVYKTLENLARVCPGFRIVLCLSSDEFPGMEKDLPQSIYQAIKKYPAIEILWVKKNLKSFKKVIFTASKYPHLPVISADDDCLYRYNYALILYNKWKSTKNIVYRFNLRNMLITQGPCTIYPPSSIFNLHDKVLNVLTDELIEKSLDDSLITKILQDNNIKIRCATNSRSYPFVFHTDVDPITKNQREMKVFRPCFEAININFPS